MVGMTQLGASSKLSKAFRPLRGVFLALSGVLGVFLADAGAESVALRGVCGSRLAVEAGSALLR